MIIMMMIMMMMIRIMNYFISSAGVIIYSLTYKITTAKRRIKILTLLLTRKRNNYFSWGTKEYLYFFIPRQQQ
jgi:hypothetical protein